MGSLKFPSKNSCFSLTTSDIVFPRQTYYNKPCRNLDVSDIEGARPRPKRSIGVRLTNPLEPEYLLPSYSTNTHKPPKFVRDSISVADIQGAQPCLTFEAQMKTRDHMDYSDIGKCVGGWKIRNLAKKPTRTRNLNVSDINSDYLGLHRFWFGKRQTNPLNPIYEFKGGSLRSSEKMMEFKEKEIGIREAYNKDGSMLKFGSIHEKPKTPTAASIGPIAGSKPTKLFIDLNKPKNRSLLTQDIEGATVVRDEYRRMRPMVKPNGANSSDIPGAKANSFCYFNTTRKPTNPLMPRYTLLDTPRKKRNSPSASSKTTMPKKSYAARAAREAVPKLRMGGLNKMRSVEALANDITTVRDL